MCEDNNLDKTSRSSSPLGKSKVSTDSVGDAIRLTRTVHAIFVARITGLRVIRDRPRALDNSYSVAVFRTLGNALPAACTRDIRRGRYPNTPRARRRRVYTWRCVLPLCVASTPAGDGDNNGGAAETFPTTACYYSKSRNQARQTQCTSSSRSPIAVDSKG